MGGFKLKFTRGEDFPPKWHLRVVVGLVFLLLAAFFFLKPLIGR